jgi:hypothetical protein
VSCGFCGNHSKVQIPLGLPKSSGLTSKLKSFQLIRAPTPKSALGQYDYPFLYHVPHWADEKSFRRLPPDRELWPDREHEDLCLGRHGWECRFYVLACSPYSLSAPSTNISAGPISTHHQSSVDSWTRTKEGTSASNRRQILPAPPSSSIYRLQTFCRPGTSMRKASSTL